MFHELAPTLGTSWYVARRIPVAHDDAMHALGDALRNDAIVPATDVVTIGDVRHTRPGEARGFSGRLRVGRFVPPISVEVEVELEPWSGSETVLGVRPARRPPSPLRAARYFDQALDLLADLETCVRDRITVPTAAEVRRAS
jgi:hypothetical protein